MVRLSGFEQQVPCTMCGACLFFRRIAFSCMVYIFVELTGKKYNFVDDRAFVTTHAHLI